MSEVTELLAKLKAAAAATDPDWPAMLEVTRHLVRWTRTADQTAALVALPRATPAELASVCARIESAFTTGPTGPDRRQRPR